MNAGNGTSPVSNFGAHDPAVTTTCRARTAPGPVNHSEGRDADALPLGVGTVDWAEAAGALRATGYDGTVTLGVFAKEPVYTQASRDLWLAAWEAAAQ